jgi:hypothetical protein
MKEIFCLLFFCLPLFINAQSAWKPIALSEENSYKQIVSAIPSKKKLYQRNHGAILGLQRGAVTALELGAEAHWRKLSLTNPTIVGATANLGYNFGHHTIGYQAGMWMKHGRVNLTYGGNLLYYSDFRGLHRYGIGPAVGFRLAGFHLINGYNFLGGDKELEGANTLYITLRENAKKRRRKNKERKKRRMVKRKVY